jgi:hypothetical protein
MAAVYEKVMVDYPFFLAVFSLQNAPHFQLPGLSQ